MAEYYGASNDFRNYLQHYGVKGMKWRNRKHPDAFYETKGGMSQGHYRLKSAKAQDDPDSAYNKTDVSYIIDARQRASRNAKNNAVDRQLKSDPGANVKRKDGLSSGTKRTRVQNLAVAARNYLNQAVSTQRRINKTSNNSGINKAVARNGRQYIDSEYERERNYNSARNRRRK